MAGPTNTQFALAAHLLTMLTGAEGQPISSELMSGSAGTNPVHVRRVLGELRRAGLVGSRPGPRGGWQLTQPAQTITLADVWDALHADEPVLGLHAVDPDCPIGRAIHGALTELDGRVAAALRDELSRQTVAELAAQTPAAAVLA